MGSLDDVDDEDLTYINATTSPNSCVVAISSKTLKITICTSPIKVLILS
jgi:hypothetical protein